jgi:FMN phosphatase YigB (HAD superfamily)/DNA-binding XRE family transcriptional regulator
VGINQNIGLAIANLRRARGLTQDDLSAKAGISYSTLAKLERGAISSPSVYTVADIAKVLSVTVDEILYSDSGPAKVATNTEEIKFVYCDVNGVLVRFFHKAFGKISSETGASIDKIETAFWHYNEPINRGKMTIEEFNSAMEVRLNLEPGTIDWESHYMNSIETIEPMHDCLRNISKNTKVGLLSDSFPGFLKIMLKKKLLPDINYSAIVESASVHAKKPDQKIYEIAEEMAKTPGSNIFFIDDSRANLMAAEKRGWRVLWFDDYRPEESVKRVIEALSSS